MQFDINEFLKQKKNTQKKNTHSSAHNEHFIENHYNGDDIIQYNEIDVEIEQKQLDDLIDDVKNVNIENGHSAVDAAAQNKEVTFEDDNNVAINEAIVDAKNRYKLADEPPCLPTTESMKKPQHFQFSKQHTGMKNISFNVGAAVSPTDKMEFVQEEAESFGVVKLNRPFGKLSPNIIDNSDAVSTASGEGMTDQGYFDLKFYHNKLW